MRQILWMHSHFLYWMGGTKFIFELTSRLHQHIPVMVFVEDYSTLAKQYYAQAGISLERTTRKTSTSPMYWMRLPAYLNVSYDIIKRYINSDTILFSSMFPANAVLSRFANRKFQYIFEPFAFIHDHDMIQGLSPAKRLFCRYVQTRYRVLDVEATRSADRIFTLNDITAKSIRTVYGKEAIPTYTGIDTNFFKPYDAPDLRKKYAGRRVLIHSTDFSPVKGTDLLLKVLARVKDKHPNVLLLITSTINDRAKLAALKHSAQKMGVWGHIEYLGFLPYADIPRYYSFAETLLQSGVGESAGATSFSLPVKEAMACGTPVIRHPITTEDAEDGISGLLIDARDTTAYANGVIRLLDHPEEAREMGKRARQRIMSRYNWDSVIRTLLEYVG